MPDIFVDKDEEEKEVITHEEPKKVDVEKVLEKVDKAELDRGIPPLKEDIKHPHSHLITAYCEKPESVSFEDKLDDEVLLLFLRRHFITNVPWFVKTGIFALVPLVLLIIYSTGVLDLSFLPRNYVAMITIAYYLLLSGYMFMSYLIWFYNIGLVTSERIIDIDFSSIVSENVAATKLPQIEDVSYSQVGVIRSMFDYGDVLIQTAGATDQFVFESVPHPERVIKVINSLISEENNA